MSSPISFLSDFGLQDEFVGVVHGVLARVSPLSRVIDVTHNIKPGDIRGGALALTRAVQYLPEGVVMAVVDPGVGTSRRALAALTAVGYFVGPDNGLLSPAVAMVGGASVIHSIENPEIKIPGSGATFHGRDLFAPAAGLLAAGEATLADLGPELAPDSVTPLVLPLPKVEPPVVIGEAWWVDRFGNVQTNVGPEDLALIGAQPNGEIEVVIGASSYRGRWRTTFGDSPLGDLILHVDSAGLIALAIRGGRADEELHLEEGLAVTFRAAPGQPEKI
ncbi:MAG: SAM hydrolase/SAM-dependent halogenase family protein [Actinomycetota bacterium]